MNQRLQLSMDLARVYHSFMSVYLAKSSPDVETHPHLGNEFKAICIYIRHIIEYSKVPDWVKTRHQDTIRDWAKRVHNISNKELADMTSEFFKTNQPARECIYHALICLRLIKEISNL